MERTSLWNNLLQIYDEDEAREFLCSPQPFLNGMTPAEAMARNGEEGEELLRWLEVVDYGQIAT